MPPAFLDGMKIFAAPHIHMPVRKRNNNLHLPNQAERHIKRAGEESDG